MSAVSARERPASHPVQDLASSLRALDRHVSQLEKLPAQRLLEELPAFRQARAEARSLLPRMRALAERFERIAQAADGSGDEARRVAQAAARQGAEHLESLVGSNGLLESSAFASALGWTRQALSKALGARRVFYVEVRGSRYYPAFFADSRYERRRLEAVSKALGDLPGSAKLLFMTMPKASLGGLTALQAIERGGYEAVRTAAAGFAQR